GLTCRRSSRASLAGLGAHTAKRLGFGLHSGAHRAPCSRLKPPFTTVAIRGDSARVRNHNFWFTTSNFLSTSCRAIKVWTLSSLQAPAICLAVGRSGKLSPLFGIKLFMFTCKIETERTISMSNQSTRIDEVARSYAILRLNPGCTRSELKKRHKALVRQFHPDRFQGDSAAQDECTRTLRQINR